MRMRTASILLCAGKGARMRRSVPDKVLAVVAGKTVFERSLSAFIRAGSVNSVVVVYRSPAQRRNLERALAAISGASDLELAWVRGGKERSDSVAAALAALPPTVDLVLIHDCARPMVDPKMIRKLAAVARKHGAAVLAHRVTDTIKETGAKPGQPAKLTTIDRGRLWAMETPQAFMRSGIAHAYALVRERGLRITDDTQAIEIAGGKVAIVENRNPNPKITTPSDIRLIEFLLARAKH